MTFDEIIKDYEDNVAMLSPSEHTLLRAAYKAGLRRAQELAAGVFTEDCCYSRLDDFDQVIDNDLVAAACKDEP